MSKTRIYRQIGIIGTGRVACAFGRVLARFSTAPVLVWGRSAAGIQDAVGKIGHASGAHDAGVIVRSCDMIVLAVADDALGAVVGQIAAHGALAGAPFIFHVSGKNGIAVLEPLRAAGALVAAIHPAMTFTGDLQNEVRRMVGASFAISGADDQAVARAQQVVDVLGGVSVIVSDEHRALYHAALCHAANHLVTLLTGSCEALRAAGVEAPQDLLAPLVRAALDNTLRDGFAALSGPLLRGDRGTIDRHLEALAADCPQVLPAYRAMAGATLDGMERHGLAVVEGLRERLA